MKYLEIIGQRPLRGKVAISGAKNAALPLLASTLLSKNEVSFYNLPCVADINTLLTLLGHLGAKYEFGQNSAKIDTSEVFNTKALYEIVRKMRASILVLGPLLARFGHCEVSLPGGCAIGQRPIKMHLEALKKMGAKIEIKGGYVEASGKLKGARVVFEKITVGGSQNIAMAAALAKGESVLENVSIEPESLQLYSHLKASGVEIEGIGTRTLHIRGSEGELLNSPACKIIPDRIEAGTYLAAAIITQSKISLQNAAAQDLGAVLDLIEAMGSKYELVGDEISITPGQIKSADITTAEFPGFPTDLQAQFMALACLGDGTSVIDERLFENRFMHVSEMLRMGANIELNGHLAIVRGVRELSSAEVMATDLRASSALILCALAARGLSQVHRIYHLKRGYENLAQKLAGLGAKIEEKEGE